MTRILLVEDNEMNRDMLSRRLERKDFQVVMAVDGQAGVQMAHSESPDGVQKVRTSSGGKTVCVSSPRYADSSLCSSRKTARAVPKRPACPATPLST